MIANVYRAPSRDANGDPVDSDGTVIRIGADGTLVGTLDVIIGGQSVTSTNRRGDVASTDGQIGAPTDAAIRLEHGDTVVTEDGTRYKVTGPALWGRRHSLTGSTATARYRWHRVTALYN